MHRILFGNWRGSCEEMLEVRESGAGEPCSVLQSERRGQRVERTTMAHPILYVLCHVVNLVAGRTPAAAPGLRGRRASARLQRHVADGLMQARRDFEAELAGSMQVARVPGLAAKRHCRVTQLAILLAPAKQRHSALDTGR